ncbi:hypothetical protein C8Q80DRAFT_1116621 [Daedaleopsis nitida]|nr:hypothetical protein C8Q80DRAFT_1116621 [Daedaleopsis nitida]
MNSGVWSFPLGEGGTTTKRSPPQQSYCDLSLRASLVLLGRFTGLLNFPSTLKLALPAAMMNATYYIRNCLVLLLGWHLPLALVDTFITMYYTTWFNRPVTHVSTGLSGHCSDQAIWLLPDQFAHIRVHVKITASNLCVQCPSQPNASVLTMASRAGFLKVHPVQLFHGDPEAQLAAQVGWTHHILHVDFEIVVTCILGGSPTYIALVLLSVLTLLLSAVSNLIFSPVLFRAMQCLLADGQLTVYPALAFVIGWKDDLERGTRRREDVGYTSISLLARWRR